LGTLKINTGFVQLVQKAQLKNFAAFLKKDRMHLQVPKKEIMRTLLIELYQK
jgi:hypothetical protein